MPHDGTPLPPLPNMNANVRRTTPSPRAPRNTRDRNEPAPDALTRPQQQQQRPPASAPTPAPKTLPRARFSWSSSILTTFTLIGCFTILCSYASAASTSFALLAARPMYSLYPSLVAAMLMGGVCAVICYLPTMIAVLCFQALFHTDIRKNHTPPPGVPASMANSVSGSGAGASAGTGGTGRGVYREMLLSLLRDGANTIKLALVLTPIYVMAIGRGSQGLVESRSLEAASGGQLAAAIMTLKIMLVGMSEIWDLVPLVVFRLDRERR